MRHKELQTFITHAPYLASAMTPGLVFQFAIELKWWCAKQSPQFLGLMITQATLPLGRGCDADLFSAPPDQAYFNQLPIRMAA
jgi:hypothetical protein